MNITSAVFVKGVVEEDEILDDGRPQVAFIGRSNVGKSSVINSLVNQKDLAKTSSFPGRTQQANIFLISTGGGSASGGNNAWYLVDLPGYGFAKGSKTEQEQLQRLIHWYFFGSPYQQKKVVLIVDALVGVTATDQQMLHSLEQDGKDIVIVANKTDKLKNSEHKRKLQDIKDSVGDHAVIAYSAEKKIGVGELANEIFS